MSGRSRDAVMSSTTASRASGMPLGTHMKKASEIQWKPCRAPTRASAGTMPSARGVDVPPRGAGDHVARSLAQPLHRRARAGRVVFDVAAQFLQVGPGAALLPGWFAT